MKINRTDTAIELSENASLVSLSIQQMSNMKSDRNLSRDLCLDHGARQDAAQVKVSLFSRQDLANITAVVSAMRKVYYFYTFELPHDGNGQARGPRLLPTRAAEKFIVKMHELQELFNEEVDKFVADYESKVQRQRRRLNGMFKESDYLPPSAVRDAFHAGLSITPMPTVAGINVGQFTEQYRAQEAERQSQVVTKVTADLAERLRDAVKHLAERVAVAGEEKARVHSTIFSNVQDLIDLIPACNIANDDGLDQLAAEAAKIIEQAGRKPVDAVKHSAALRNRISAEAKALSTKASTYF